MAFKLIPNWSEPDTLHMRAKVNMCSRSDLTEGEPSCLAFLADEQWLTRFLDRGSEYVTLFASWAKHRSFVKIGSTSESQLLAAFCRTNDGHSRPLTDILKLSCLGTGNRKPFTEVGVRVPPTRPLKVEKMNLRVAHSVVAIETHNVVFYGRLRKRNEIATIGMPDREN